MFLTSGNVFYWKSTIGTTLAATEANNDTYCLQDRVEKLIFNLLHAAFSVIGLSFKKPNVKTLLDDKPEPQHADLDCNVWNTQI